MVLLVNQYFVAVIGTSLHKGPHTSRQRLVQEDGYSTEKH